MSTAAASTSIKRAFRQPAFISLVLLLGVCAFGLNAAAGYLKLHFKKQACALRISPLKAGIPRDLGHWVMVGNDQSIDPEVKQVLGTDEYLFRDYVNRDKIPADDLKMLTDANTSNGQIQQQLIEYQKKNPDWVMRVAVTYYTGLVDTVAHVPERCYVADGYEVTSHEEIHAALGNDEHGKPRDLTFRYLHFSDQVGGRSVARNVGYVFQCNGSYEDNPYRVRQQLQNLFERYGYYAKIELMTVEPDSAAEQGFKSYVGEMTSRDRSVVAMEDFLAEALPHVERCLPDWKALHEAKGAPAAAVAAAR